MCPDGRYVAAREDSHSHGNLMKLSGLNAIPVLPAHNLRPCVVSLSAFTEELEHGMLLQLWNSLFCKPNQIP